MDFDLTEEQRILKWTARESWRKMAEMGWPGLVLPEKYGGSDGSFLDLTVLLEEMGYHLSPCPLFSTVVPTKGVFR
jgi:alkylation response protein AidB-like acyl-CoA dehydrogenase